jgi:hypothetical protein
MTTATITEKSLVATHNGMVTIENPKTGQHRTFSIKTQPKDARFSAGKRIVALLNGPDNESSYYGFGFVVDGRVVVWSKKRGGKFDVYADMLNRFEAWTKNTGVNFLFETTCRVCNRKLTTPESIINGIGPVCEGRGE